jgi:hypothetical protein
MVWGWQELASKLMHMLRIRSRCGLYCICWGCKGCTWLGLDYQSTRLGRVFNSGESRRKSMGARPANSLVPALACDCGQAETCAFVESCGVECSNGRFHDSSTRKASVLHPTFRSFLAAGRWWESEEQANRAAAAACSSHQKRSIKTRSTYWRAWLFSLLNHFIRGFLSVSVSALGIIVFVCEPHASSRIFSR